MEPIAAKRARRLRQWINLKHDGNQTEFIGESDLTLSQIGQWLGGHRNMSEMSARRIETMKGMPFGYLDEMSWDEETIGVAIWFQRLNHSEREAVKRVAYAVLDRQPKIRPARNAHNDTDISGPPPPHPLRRATDRR